MNIKQLYRRFKSWQINAFDWSFDQHELHYCVNCENDFAGNYCPHCSQQAGLTKISWKNVLQSTAEVWGMHNRSFLYSLWQLMFRPGYFISDYINGKRQVSFPPVKMLVLMGVISILVDHLFGNCPHGHFHSNCSLVEHFADFQDASPGWFWLILSCFVLIPTWCLFRYAPRNTKHTLPQGFFIQVFMAIQVLIVDDFSDFFTNYFYIFLPLCYFYAYRQLFGYNFWGNFWRVLVLLFCGFSVFAIALKSVEWYFEAAKLDADDYKVLVFYLFISFVPLLVGWYISKKTYNRRENKKDLQNLEISADVQTENNNQT